MLSSWTQMYEKRRSSSGRAGRTTCGALVVPSPWNQDALLSQHRHVTIRGLLTNRAASQAWRLLCSGAPLRRNNCGTSLSLQPHRRPEASLPTSDHTAYLPGVASPTLRLFGKPFPTETTLLDHPVLPKAPRQGLLYQAPCSSSGITSQGKGQKPKSLGAKLNSLLHTPHHEEAGLLPTVFPQK